MQWPLVYMSKVDGKFNFSPISVNFLTEIAKVIFAIVMLLLQRKLPSPKFMVEVVLADINATIPSSETASTTPEETPSANSAPVDGSA
ncbi:PREDICTED: phosphatidylinositol 3,4,5-trisphosphate 3-phosphatase and protein-tyrosine-phosphatase PTEN2A-like [Camelina sativa]|uniref:Phosphatidylinositol 3,4,5-trisphosphate 3-phosphatase and protein-tyrosine-phosphatase PTEN2A-like n=1 Tax=Camelina sativa TaxID=90675 RepID=A0ABM1QPU1_CAMSA|nr:PREDICTED: phosphatidylinositol 3,4,5-trisphosphate 3-phosphatase and protein-tyrosine-phosphatase PTEN2A-like [Camelina sativa]XP_019088779.1 PREDICTED: phosphatidylinositol 3,4,5-trisphosphate 3-phosphatase and protein-tyrosine-phosphatase PTEN2A-like [Camelina sativa]XP_019088783.1 PREDICTED: phosphatidylinositol 3,4,5-trisphosphate 3-phosphatase and protein-tyrosine-phosphatase PTEN2A-like [Camelina sativa]